MLETTIDREIFIDFCKSQPSPVPFGSEEDNREWLSFWSFLKSGTNLKFIDCDRFNGQNAENRLLTTLASGRGDAKIEILSKYNWPHRNALPKDTFPGSFFCLEQEDQEKRTLLTKRNGMLFAFKDNYRDQWQKLSISGKKHLTFHVRREFAGENSLKDWTTLSRYILPFTDVIICDKFINDKSVRDYNLLQIMRTLDKLTPVEYNLLIITNKGDRNFLDEFEGYLKEKIVEYKLKAKLGIVLSRREHDRCIIMNCLKIESGDSFNFFNHDGSIITNGTELKLFPLCYTENFNDVRVKLSRLKQIVDNERDDTRGNLINRLFEYCNG